VLEDWNANNLPPLTDEFLAEKIRNAYHYAPESPFGNKLVEPLADWKPGATAKVETSNDNEEEEPADLKGLPDSECIYEFINRAPREVEWLLQPFLERKSVNLLAAPDGGAKSWLAADWAVQVVHGGENILYLYAEDPEGSVADRFRRLLDGRPVPKETLRIRHRQGVMLDDSKWRRKIAREIRKRKIALLVVDTYAKSRSIGKEVDPDDVGRFLLACEEFAKAGATVLLLHHLNAEGEIRGSTALRAGCSGVFLLKRARKGVTQATVLKLKSNKDLEASRWSVRAVDEIEETRVRVYVERLPDKLSESERAEETADTLEVRILKALPKLSQNVDEGLTKQAIAGALGISRNTKELQDALDALKRAPGGAALRKNSNGKWVWFRLGDVSPFAAFGSNKGPGTFPRAENEGEAA
jgi:hypothetical protein